MRKPILLILLGFIASSLNGQIIDHNCIRLQEIPVTWIEQAKADLHIVYEHTSHGSQIVSGMSGLFSWLGDTYAWSDGPAPGALDLDDHGITGWSDLGNPDFTSWAASTRTYLDNPENSDVNVVMWSWCGELTYATAENIDTYLGLMSTLEAEYPGVRFVYMTGHLDGTGLTGNLHLRNEQIRVFCRDNNKILYDFENIESYDPDGVYYGAMLVNDGCNYDYDGDGVTESSGDPSTPYGGDRNWAIDWQESHTVNVDWYNTPVAHSQPLNGNLKAYAAWWLWAVLAGWDPNPETEITTGNVTGSPFCAGEAGVTVTFSYMASTSFPGSTFTAQLSDHTGSFATPTSVGSVTSDGTGSQVISATIPASASTGTGYRIRVVSLNPDVTGTDNGSGLTIYSSGTWIGGAADNADNWNNSSNWCGGIPSQLTTVILNPAAAVQPVISGPPEATCNHMFLPSGTSCTVQPGQTLTVNGNLMANGTVTIESDVMMSASLIVRGTSSGAVTYKRQFKTRGPEDTYPEDNYDWHYFSSPVGSNSSVNSGKISALWAWDEASNNWTDLTGTVSLESGIGYNLDQTAESDGMLTFTGTLVTSPLSIMTTSPYDDCDFTGTDYGSRTFVPERQDNYGAGGWNLLGNPFTSSLDAQAFLDENAGSFDPNYQALYVYDGSIGERGEFYYIGSVLPGWENSATPGAYSAVQAGQGFFVIAKCNTTSFLFTPAMQVHNTEIPVFKSRSGDEGWPGLRLNIKHNATEKSTLLVLSDDMTAGLDPGYDVGLYQPDNELSIYTRMPDDNGIRFTRQAVPVSGSDTTAIPVGIEAAEGGLVVFSSTARSLRNFSFYLEDRETGLFTDITRYNYDVVLPVNTSGTGRFYIHSVFKPRKQQDDGYTTPGGKRIWASGGQLFIEGDTYLPGTVTVHGQTGRLLLKKSLEDSYLNIINLPYLPEGLFIVKITDRAGVSTKKLVLLNRR